jgi:hypothetical protein
MEKEQEIKNAVTDLVGDLFYYDRKEDEELNRDDMAQLSNEDKLQIIEWFKEEVMK